MLSHDIRYGLRLLLKAPGFSVVAIASLAVGIGASTVLFSFAHSVVLRPLPASRPEQLIQIFTSGSTGSIYNSSTYADYERFRANPVFAGLLASMRTTATLSQNERPDLIRGLLVSGNYFDVLGLRPARGRFFASEETGASGAQPVVVLSHDAWRRRFGADDAIVGRAVELSGRSFTVIGIGPPRFTGTNIEEMADFFVPAAMYEAFSGGTDLLRDRRQRTFRILGRLKDRVALPEAAAALRATATDLLQQDPAAWRDRNGRGRFVTVLPETAARFAGAGPGTVEFIFASVMASVVALLAIACVNVATVLLARATTRRKEIAVRLALGASRWRLVRQLLTECALLAAAGGALGLLIAQSAAALFLRFRPDEVPAVDLTLDNRVLLFSLAASVATVVLFGLAPALQATRLDLHAALKDVAKGVRIRSLRFGLRAGLVMVQVALSLALTISAALMLRSAHAGRTADPGFRRDDVLNVGIDLSTVPDRGGARARFYDQAVRAAAALPAVDRVALAALVPQDGANSQTTIRIEEDRSPISTSPDINIVGAGYFALLDIPVRQGREFTAADTASSPPVAIVNETMARYFWKGAPVGRAFIVENTGEQVQIVGVAGDLRHRSFGEDPIPMVYFCAAQRYRARMTLHVRTAVPASPKPRGGEGGAAQVIAPSLLRMLHEIDRTAALTRPETMHDYFGRVTMPQRVGAGAAMATALLEVALAVMALYGVMAFAVSQRRREIGLRMALGASGRSVIALVMREGLLLIAVGVVVGIAIALAAGTALQSLLIGIGPADPLSFGGAVLALVVVGTAASYVPARSASSIEPAAALRSE